MEFKEKIKSLRSELGFTMEDLAKLVGVSAPTIQRYESGEIKNVRKDKIKLLADALQTTPGYLMDWEESVKHSTLTVKSNDTYTQNEKSLLSNFKKLNTIGEHEAIKRIEELTCISRYTENKKKIENIIPDYLQPVAAHNDFAEDEEQQRLMQEDLDEI